MDNSAGDGQTQYLTFHLAGEEYAVGILKVKEIIEYGTLTVVPQTPPSVRGVINLRGNVVPVVDLAVKLGMACAPITNRTCIVIVEAALDGEPAVMGVIADSVSQVIDLPAAEILVPPAFGTRIKADFLLGMGKAEKKFFLIIDIDKLLAADELSVASTGNPARFETAAGKPLAQ
ncbi:MAG: chemotaxis protein CheW [Deltaproteobacteria bacterium]|nr:chemotaxis protein CheW [Deltaproteobacteria bacterium]